MLPTSILRSNRQTFALKLAMALLSLFSLVCLSQAIIGYAQGNATSLSSIGSANQSVYLPLVVRKFPLPTTISILVTPSNGGSLVSPNEQVKVDFPPGAVDTLVTITYTYLVSPNYDSGALIFANTSFLLEAEDSNGNPVTTYNQPFTLTISYHDLDWQNAGIADESSLNLYWLDGSQWVASLPCSGCSHDLVNNKLVIVLDHLTEFAVLGNASAAVTSTPTPNVTDTPSLTPTQTTTGTPPSTTTEGTPSTPTETPTSSQTPTDTSTATAISSPSTTPTGTQTPTPNSTSTPTSTGAQTNTPTNTPTPTATSTSTTATSTNTSTSTPTSTPTESLTGTPTLTLTPTPTTGPGQAIIINHSNTDITMIPSDWIETVKQKIAWIFVHTSHGSQLVTGAHYLSQYENPPLYNFINRDGQAPYDFYIPTQVSPIALRMGNNSNWGYSEPDFRAMIQQHITSANYGPDDVPVFMFAFCGQVDYMTPDEVQQYLDDMAWGESAYPQVTFVYITDHADNGADQDVLNANNNMIRNYVNAHNKILYDFLDIDTYQPDGSLPPGTPDDSCPWCQNWCDTHPGFCPDFSGMGECAHSHSLQCLLKSEAMWWLSARLAGWDGQTR